MAATKKLVSFDSEAFNSKMAEWKKKKELEKDIIAKTKFMFGSLDWTLKPSDLFPSPHLKIFKIIEKVFADETLWGCQARS